MLNYQQNVESFQSQPIKNLSKSQRIKNLSKSPCIKNIYLVILARYSMFSSTAVHGLGRIKSKSM